jgi:Acetolactate synthase
VRFINLNVMEFDAYKHSALPLVGDARATLEELLPVLAGYRTAPDYQAMAESYNRAWEAEVARIYAYEHQPLLSQAR